MKIKFYKYNTFLIESDDKKIAIDPGAFFLYFFRFKTLIPESEWEAITHLFVTHGDPDHYWHADRVAKASGAKFICNKKMLEEVNGEKLLLGPRDKGLAFTTKIKNVHPISLNETIELDNMQITSIKATHGPLKLKVGPLSKTVTPGPDERIGWGGTGYKIQFNGKTIVNLGDTILHLDKWKDIKNPDVLMIPIGGREALNTMDEKEALEVVQMVKPKLVIPCHYNEKALFTKKYCPADENMFKREVEKLQSKCIIMKYGDEISI